MDHLYHHNEKLFEEGVKNECISMRIAWTFGIEESRPTLLVRVVEGWGPFSPLFDEFKEFEMTNL